MYINDSNVVYELYNISRGIIVTDHSNGDYWDAMDRESMLIDSWLFFSASLINDWCCSDRCS